MKTEKNQKWLVFTIVTMAVLQALFIILKRNNENKDFDLPVQYHDDTIMLILELIISTCVIYLGGGVILWFFILPIFIVVGPAVISALVYAVGNKIF